MNTEERRYDVPLCIALSPEEDDETVWVATSEATAEEAQLAMRHKRQWLDDHVAALAEDDYERQEWQDEMADYNELVEYFNAKFGAA